MSTTTASAPVTANPAALRAALDLVPLDEVITKAFPGSTRSPDGANKKLGGQNWKYRVPGLDTMLSVCLDVVSLGWGKGAQGAKGGVALLALTKKTTHEAAIEWMATTFPEYAARSNDPTFVAAMIKRQQADAALPQEKSSARPVGPLKVVNMPKEHKDIYPEALAYLTKRRHFDPGFAAYLLETGYFLPTVMSNEKPEFAEKAALAEKEWAAARALAPDTVPVKFERPKPGREDRNYYHSIATPMLSYEDIDLPKKRILGFSHRAIQELAAGDGVDKKNWTDGNPKTAGGAIIGILSPATKTVVVTESPIEGAAFYEVHTPDPSVCVIGICGEGMPTPLIQAIKPYGISVVSAFNNDFAGRKFASQMAALCKDAGLPHHVHLPKNGTFTLAAVDNDENRRRVEVIKKTAVAEKTEFSHLETEKGGLNIRVGSSDATTSLAKDFYDHNRKQGLSCEVEYHDKDWDDVLRARAFGLERETGGHQSHPTAKVEVEEHRLAEKIDNERRDEAEKVEKADREKTPKAPSVPKAETPDVPGAPQAAAPTKPAIESVPPKPPAIKKSSGGMDWA